MAGSTTVLAMLGNPVDDNTLALRVLSGLPFAYGMLRTVVKNKDVKLVMSNVTAKLLQVEQRNMSAGSSKPFGSGKSRAFAAAAPKKSFTQEGGRVLLQRQEGAHEARLLQAEG